MSRTERRWLGARAVGGFAVSAEDAFGRLCAKGAKRELMQTVAQSVDER